MRKLATFALSFAAAACISVYILPLSFAPFVAAAIALMGLTALFFKTDVRLRIILIASGLAIGSLWTYGYGSIFHAPAQALDGQILEVTATVSDYPTPTDYGSLAEVRLHAPDGRSYKSLLYITDLDLKLLPGDELSFTAGIRYADTFWNEDTLYYASKGIILKLTPKTEIAVSRPETLPLKYYPAVLCQMVELKAMSIFPPDIACFMKALLTGDSSDLTNEFYRDIKMAGIIHALVISGMHVSLLVGFIQLLVRRRRLSAMICIPIIIFFMAMIGYTPSVVRAGFMNILLLVAPLLRRENDPPTSLCVSLLILLAVNPYSISDVGLQLSFGCMAGLTLFSNKLYNYFCSSKINKKLIRVLPLSKKENNPILNAVYASLSASLSSMVFIIPLQMIYFESPSVVSPVSNLLCLYAISIAFPIGVASCALGLLWTPLGTAVGYLAWPLVKYVIGVISLLARIPFAAISTASYLVKAWVIYAYATVFVFFRLKGGRKVFPVALCTVTLVIVLLIGEVEKVNLEFSFTAVDVGQGQSIVLSSKGKNVIVDCGGTKDPAGAVADYLAGTNSHEADYLILTHYHDDHAGDVPELMALINIGCIIMPDIEDDSGNKDMIIEASELYGTEIFLLSSDSALTLGSLDITIFEPLSDYGANEQCITILASAGDYDILITGDMDSEIEKRLISQKYIPDIEVLVVGHHGSKYSSCSEFLWAVTPEFALISVGVNSYGHPAEATLERLKEVGAAVYRCDLHGNITISK